jgi:hypothetical protein
MTMLAERPPAAYDDGEQDADGWTFAWTGLRQPRATILLMRISDARDDDTDGVDRQEARQRRWAKSNGWRIGPAATHVIIENDTSAYKRRRLCVECRRPRRDCTCPPLPGGGRRRTVLRTVRPEFWRALDMLESGEADGLLAVDLDRVCRDPRDLEDLLDAATDNGQPRIPVHSTTGSLSLMTSAGADMARMMVTVANKSSRDTARRVADKRESKANAGEWGGGRRPYGWGVQKTNLATGEPLTDDKTGRPVLDMNKLVPAEAAEIRQWGEQILAGVSLRAVTADLRERGVPTVTGVPWDAATVRDILLRPRNAGLAVYRVRAAAKTYTDRGEPVPYDCGVIGKGGWEPVMEEDEWRAVAVILADPARRTSPGNTPRWFGSMIYRCGVCRAAGVEQTCSISSGAAEREPAYMCRGPVGHLRRSARRVDEYVADVIIARLSAPDAAAAFAGTGPEPADTAGLSAELNAARERANQLGAAFADGTISAAQLRAGSERLNGRIREIEAALAATVQRSPLDTLPLGTEQVRERWEALPLGTRRAILRTLCEVTLLKGKPGRYASGAYFDGSTVDIQWK